MKLISWNVNGLRACVTKGFADTFRALDADIFCLQETKMQEGQLDLAFPGYHSYWNSAEKKGYSGTAVFTRHEPLSVTKGIGIEVHDHEGRVLTLEMADFFLVCVYTPNSQDQLRRLSYRMQWEEDFQAYLHRLDSQKPVIVCGDLNVAHEEIDIKNPKTNRRNAGFTDEEREKMTTLLKSGFTDSFRSLYPTQVTYSWWSYRFHAREKNAGWRIDYFIVSQRLMPRVKNADIWPEITGRRRGWRTRKSTPRSSVRTTAPSSLTSAYEGSGQDTYHLCNRPGGTRLLRRSAAQTYLCGRRPAQDLLAGRRFAICPLRYRSVVPCGRSVGFF